MTSAPATSRPSLLACHACRRRHLKCDGASPVCGRCAAESLVCTYTASRRGLGRRNARAGRSAVRSTTSTAPPTPMPTSPLSSNHVALPDLVSAMPSTQDTLQSLSNQFPALQSCVPAAPWSLRAADRDRLLSLFYVHFFGAHPFVVPRAFYAAQQYPRYLDLTVCLVGLHFATPVPDDAAALPDAVSFAMSEIDEQTPHRVQALILYAIILHARQQPKEAASCVKRAAGIALGLSMNEPSFARTNAGDSSVVEESLRRTWWELYTVDVYIAAIHRRPTFETFSAKSLPLLPCAQALYEAGQCDPDPPTLRAFEDRVFSPDLDAGFSPLCFRIDAIRTVGRVLALAATDHAHPDNIQALDNALASWEYNLPPLYTDVIDPSGEVDLMLFEAPRIFLHFPRSDLPATVPSASDIACAKGYTQLVPTSRHHTIKAIAASKDLANLATVPWPLERHSPFFICGLVLGCIIQLAAASIHMHQCGLHCLQQHRDRIVLIVGALRRLGEKWTLAQNAVCNLNVVAETVFSTRDKDGAPSPEACSFQDSAVDAGESTGNPLWFDLFAAEDMQSNFYDS